VERLDDAFADTLVVVPRASPRGASTPDDAAHTAASLPTQSAPDGACWGIPADSASTPDTWCGSVASAVVSPPSMQPADAPIGTIGASPSLSLHTNASQYCPHACRTALEG
jgi:hypothetical protein